LIDARARREVDGWVTTHEILKSSVRASRMASHAACRVDNAPTIAADMRLDGDGCFESHYLE
jgi:hypothetical protein